METEAIFENIASRIQEEIQKAEKSIYIAVAWFTNKKIFEKLVLKASEGCMIHLIISNDAINNNSAIDFEELQEYDSKVYKIGDGDTDLMHHKFCVIDKKTVITGSYNWSYKAENNIENITINKNNFELAKQFISEFKKTKKRDYKRESYVDIELPVKIIIKLLKLLKKYIEINDIENIKVVTKKLKKYNFNDDIKAIINTIHNKEFKNGVTIIEKFIKSKARERKLVIEIFQRNTKLFVDVFLEIFLTYNNSFSTEKFIEKYNNSSCEPKILYNETIKSYYYIDQNTNVRVYYDCLPLLIKSIDNGEVSKNEYRITKICMLCDIFIPIQIEQISLRLAYNYFNKSNLNFNNINLKKGKNLINLKAFIEQEIIEKIKVSNNQGLQGKLSSFLLKRSLGCIDEYVSNVKEIFKVISDIDTENEGINNIIKIRLSLIEDKGKIDSVWSESSIIPFNKVYSNLLPNLSNKKNRMYWYMLSSDESFSWSFEFIEKQKNKLLWKRLSSNIALPLSIELIEKYEKKWEWHCLTKNQLFPWSVNTIHKFAEKIEYKFIIVKTLLPFIDRDMIGDVFERIKKNNEF